MVSVGPTTEFCTRLKLNRGQAIGTSLQKIWKSQHTDFNEEPTLRNNEETRLDAFEMEGLRKILRVSWSAKKSNEWVLNKAGVKKEGTVRHRQSNEASILWSHHEETRELPGEKDNARNNARCTQAGKTTHGLDRQHQHVDRTRRGRVNKNDIGQR